MKTLVSFESVEDLGFICVDSPPVNAISAQVTKDLNHAIDAFEAAQTLKALVVFCAGKTFVAGGDIKAFEDPSFSAQPFNRTLARLEGLGRPVVASLHGTVLGGGLELAMACHARIALPGTKFGQPEIKLGLIPGSLGTQRLPRLVPVNVALDMMLTGQAINADKALALGLIDEVVQAADAKQAAVAFVSSKVAGGFKGKVTSQLPARVEADVPQAGAKKLGNPAMQAIVESVKAAVELPFAQGEQVEARLFEACVKSSQSKALRHLFFAERECSRIPSLSSQLAVREIRKVGVIGAGTMGGGIAMNFANVDLPTILLDAKQEFLERGLALVRKNYENTVAKGRLTQEAMDKRWQCLKGTLNYADLADCDLVIEAVFEDLALKKQVMAQLGKVCKPGAIIATNTSTLNVDEIAIASGRPADVVGTHFFSPANVMRLLEVVRGAQTSPDVLQTVMNLARRIGKTAVVSGVCYGFIGNRMAEPYMRENEFLLLEGASPAQIDAAVEDIGRVGMAMGPCRMLDMAGIDVGAKTLIELGKAGGLPPDPSYRAVCQTIHAQGRAGQKTGSGYYKYQGRTPLPESLTEETCVHLAKQHGIERRSHISADEIVERLMLPLINEAALILEEGIALRPGDIDVVWVAGYGFPDHQGGPLWMADSWGIAHVVERLEHYARLSGNRFNYWTPAPLLKRLAASGQRISDWTK